MLFIVLAIFLIVGIATAVYGYRVGQNAADFDFTGLIIIGTGAIVAVASLLAMVGKLIYMAIAG